MIQHNIKHYYQPTNHTCSQSSLAAALSFYGVNITPEQIVKKIPVNKNAAGEEFGTIIPQLATWCIGEGFDVVMYSADFEVLDLSWADLSKEKRLERMKATKDTRLVPALGKEWSKVYMQSYIDFLSAGGELHIIPYMNTGLIDSLLPDGPVIVDVCFNVLYNTGRSNDVGLRKTENDDVGGKLTNHTVVIFGKNDNGEYLLSDPYQEPGTHKVGSERLLAAMAAAQMECDNIIFQLSKNSAPASK